MMRLECFSDGYLLKGMFRNLIYLAFYNTLSINVTGIYGKPGIFPTPILSKQ